MIVLAIDTAGAACAVALYDDAEDRLLAAVSETLGRGHAERLMAMIDEALVKAGLGLQAVERIAVTIGPGSFTGIRVGVAAARGLALALEIEAIGVSTLAVLAAAVTADAAAAVTADAAADARALPVLAAMDAKRDEVYAQLFAADGSPLDEARILSVSGYRELAAATRARFAGSARNLIEPDAGVVDLFPIDLVARLGANRQASGKPRPLYLRGPDAKPQAGFAVARVDTHA